MKLHVPTVYECEVVLPRCRKPKFVLVKGKTLTEIKEVGLDDFPIAIEFGGESLRLFNSALWKKSTIKDSPTSKPREVHSHELIANTENGINNSIYSSATKASPFFRCWDRFNFSYELRMAQLADENIKPSTLLALRRWIGDNLRDIRRIIKAIADDLLICNGVVFEKVNEPYYVVTTFGMGSNHGGTGLFPECKSVAHENAFNALQYTEACKYRDKVAFNRGDLDSIPSANCNEEPPIKVLIPDAIKIARSTALIDCEEVIA